MKMYANHIFIFILVTTPFFCLYGPATTAWQLKSMLLQERNNPSLRAFLDTIALAEGTYYPRALGYKMRYPTGTTFASFDAHPALVICARSRNKELCSTAAGRYMFLEHVWNTVARRLELSDFSPLNQDLAALYLLHERRAIADIKNGDLRQAIDKVKHVWSSLPGSPHKQPVRKYEMLRKIFLERQAHYKKYLKGKEWA